jgi:ABC-2 type transport system ATP-binding protein
MRIAPGALSRLDHSRTVSPVLVTIEHLTKAFGNFRAVDDLSFEVNRGETVGLVGPNGAGKTTTIHMLLGLISPSSGSIRLFSKSLDQDREAILQRLNFTSPYMALPGRLTVWENLRVFAQIYGIPRMPARIDELLRQFGVSHLRNKPVARLSSGESTRVGLCKAFLNEPELLLLDEPTAYLDPQAALQVRNTLLELQRRHGTAILYTSHNMREVQRLCSRLIFLNGGRMVASGTPIEVTRQILMEDRDEPALDEVFIRVAGRHQDEAISN